MTIATTASLPAVASSSTDADRRASNRVAAVEIARLMADTKCVNVRVLDVSGVSPVCDFLVVGTGTSARQMKTVADDVAEWGDDHNLRSYGKAGTGENWIALDLIDIVVHVFSQEGRMYYDLDNLWGDAVDIEWKRGA